MTPPSPETPRPWIADACVCCGAQQLARSPAILMPFLADRIFGWKPVAITSDWGLRTISPGMAYSLCNSVQCQDCAHIFLDIRFTDSQMQSLYADYRGVEYTQLREHYEPGYAAQNERLNQPIHYLESIEAFLTPLLPPRPRILDWGGDNGHNTPFQGRNSAHDVFDISDKPAIWGARRVGAEEMALNAYDLVVCSNVLEHTPYPLNILQDVAGTLRAESVLYLELPYENILRLSDDDLQAHQHKKHWHEHINFFSRRSLTALIERSGLRVLQAQETNVGTQGAPAFVFQLACRLV